MDTKSEQRANSKFGIENRKGEQSANSRFQIENRKGNSVIFRLGVIG